MLYFLKYPKNYTCRVKVNYLSLLFISLCTLCATHLTAEAHPYDEFFDKKEIRFTQNRSIVEQEKGDTTGEAAVQARQEMEYMIFDECYQVTEEGFVVTPKEVEYTEVGTHVTHPTLFTLAIAFGRHSLVETMLPYIDDLQDERLLCSIYKTNCSPMHVALHPNYHNLYFLMDNFEKVENPESGSPQYIEKEKCLKSTFKTLRLLVANGGNINFIPEKTNWHVLPLAIGTTHQPPPEVVDRLQAYALLLGANPELKSTGLNCGLYGEDARSTEKKWHKRSRIAPFLLRYFQEATTNERDDFFSPGEKTQDLLHELLEADEEEQKAAHERKIEELTRELKRSLATSAELKVRLRQHNSART